MCDIPKNKFQKGESKMFGNPLYVKTNGMGITLRPYKDPDKSDEMARVAEYLSSLIVTKFAGRHAAVTERQEADWWKRASETKDSVVWAIVPEGFSHPIGTTGLHEIDPISGSCVSGIILDKSVWGRGIATLAHLARTWFAVEVLNRLTIQSTVRAENIASLRALKRVGYIPTGSMLRNAYILGHYVDTVTLTWLNPRAIDTLYPEELPRKYNQYVERARAALELAKSAVKVL